MGTLISLDEYRSRPPAQGPVRTTFWFDLADPGTYLAAERVDRLLPGVAWHPALLPAAGGDAQDGEPFVRRAATLGLPLVWPDPWPAPVPRAMRAAAYAAECGRAGPFVLAASRLAFCGGFDLDDPETLAEAAAAAGLGLRECLRAAGDATRDAAMQAAGSRLSAAGAVVLPAVRTGHALFVGEQRIGEAAACTRDMRPMRQSPDVDRTAAASD